jgi:hypothetical protein
MAITSLATDRYQDPRAVWQIITEAPFLLSQSYVATVAPRRGET